MVKEKKPVHRVQITERKRNIIHQLLEEYDIRRNIGRLHCSDIFVLEKM